MSDEFPEEMLEMLARTNPAVALARFSNQQLLDGIREQEKKLDAKRATRKKGDTYLVTTFLQELDRRVSNDRAVGRPTRRAIGDLPGLVATIKRYMTKPEGSNKDVAEQYKAVGCIFGQAHAASTQFIRSISSAEHVDVADALLKQIESPPLWMGIELRVVACMTLGNFAFVGRDKENTGQPLITWFTNHRQRIFKAGLLMQKLAGQQKEEMMKAFVAHQTSYLLGIGGQIEPKNAEDKAQAAKDAVEALTILRKLLQEQQQRMKLSARHQFKPMSPVYQIVSLSLAYPESFKTVFPDALDAFLPMIISADRSEGANAAALVNLLCDTKEVAMRVLKFLEGRTMVGFEASMLNTTFNGDHSPDRHRAHLLYSMVNPGGNGRVIEAVKFMRTRTDLMKAFEGYQTDPAVAGSIQSLMKKLVSDVNRAFVAEEAEASTEPAAPVAVDPKQVAAQEFLLKCERELRGIKFETIEVTLGELLSALDKEAHAKDSWLKNELSKDTMYVDLLINLIRPQEPAPAALRKRRRLLFPILTHFVQMKNDAVTQRMVAGVSSLMALFLSIIQGEADQGVASQEIVFMWGIIERWMEVGSPLLSDAFDDGEVADFGYSYFGIPQMSKVRPNDCLAGLKAMRVIIRDKKHATRFIGMLRDEATVKDTTNKLVDALNNKVIGEHCVHLIGMLAVHFGDSFKARARSRNAKIESVLKSDFPAAYLLWNGEATIEQATDTAASPDTPTVTPVIEIEKKCDECGKSAHACKLKVCSGCKSVWYCGEECQRNAWKGHKAACKQMAGKA